MPVSCAPLSKDGREREAEEDTPSSSSNAEAPQKKSTATAGTGELPCDTPSASSDGRGNQHGLDPSTLDEEEDEDIDALLMTIEQEIRKDVPDLLETMNRASGEVNDFEGQAGNAQERYRKLLDRWSRHYEQLRGHYGSSIDRARPYFDALQALNAAKREVQCAAREFSAAASQHTHAKAELRAIEERLAYGAHKVALDQDQQDGLSRATVHVLRCQQERDQREQDYARVLKEYQESEESAEAWRSQIGESAIRRALPCFKQLQQHQQTLAHEQTRINTLVEKAKSAKASYNHSLKELDRISNAVREARKSHLEVVSSASLVAAQAAPSPRSAPASTDDGRGDTACGDAGDAI